MERGVKVKELKGRGVPVIESLIRQVVIREGGIRIGRVGFIGEKCWQNLTFCNACTLSICQWTGPFIFTNTCRLQKVAGIYVLRTISRF